MLEPLGANCAGSQFLNPDGNFPNHVPNPEDAEAMASATAAVLAADADLGVVFDTDVDRSGACVCASPFSCPRAASLRLPSLRASGRPTVLSPCSKGWDDFKPGSQNVV